MKLRDRIVDALTTWAILFLIIGIPLLLIGLAIVYEIGVLIAIWKYIFS